MNRVAGIISAACIVFACLASAQAETDIRISGQVRMRSESFDKNFSSYYGGTAYRDLRTRLTVEAIVDSNAHAYIQLQDSRRFGDNDASGTTNDLKNVDMHQAYIQIDRLGYDGAGGKVGRFEVNFGNQRLFGSVDWSNVGRAWEGGMGWYRNEQMAVTVMNLKRHELSGEDDYADYDISGLYGECPKVGVDLFGFYERDDLEEVVAGEEINLLDRFTVGSYFKRTFSKVDVEGNLAYQFGQQVMSVGTELRELDLSAFLVTAEIGYTFPGQAKVRIAGGVDYASGDDNYNDDTYHAFDNLYYTGHKFRGYMDYFISSRVYGLMDLMLRGRFKPAPDWQLAADIHYFRTPAEYIDYTFNRTRDVGAELDIAVSTTAIKGVVFDGGISAFLPSESFASRSDPDPGIWSFGTITVNF